MQKILTLIIGLFSFLFLSSVVSAISPDIAQNPNQATESAVKNDYQLAYPGMLPDHPLYKVKVLRDKITEILINDPKRKADFYLLQTDKGIAAADLLIDKRNIELAKVTALKAEHNYTSLTFVYKTSQTKPDKNQYEKLVNAARKHQELLSGMIRKVGKDEEQTFKQVLNFSKTNLEEIEDIYNDE